MTSKPPNFAGVLHRLAAEQEKQQKSASVGPRTGDAIFASTTERQSPSVAAEIGNSILRAYRELVGSDFQSLEKSEVAAEPEIDFARLEKRIRGCSSKQEILQLRRRIAMRHHPDVRAAQCDTEATATMAKVNAIFDEAIRKRFS